jgi:hypothetical protein
VPEHRVVGGRDVGATHEEVLRRQLRARDRRQRHERLPGGDGVDGRLAGEPHEALRLVRELAHLDLAALAAAQVDEVGPAAVPHVVGEGGRREPREVAGPDLESLLADLQRRRAREDVDPLLLDAVHVEDERLLAGRDAPEVDAEAGHAGRAPEQRAVDLGDRIERVPERPLRRRSVDHAGAGGSIVRHRSPHGAAGASPAAVSPSTSPWPIPSVLIHRCCPSVSAMKNPSSTSSGTLKCWWSLAQSASSAMSAFHTIALVYVSAAFSRSVNLSESANRSSSSYFSSVSPFRPAWADRWTPQ